MALVPVDERVADHRAAEVVGADLAVDVDQMAAGRRPCRPNVKFFVPVMDARESAGFEVLEVFGDTARDVAGRGGSVLDHHRPQAGAVDPRQGRDIARLHRGGRRASAEFRPVAAIWDIGGVAAHHHESGPAAHFDSPQRLLPPGFALGVGAVGDHAADLHLARGAFGLGQRDQAPVGVFRQLFQRREVLHRVGVTEEDQRALALGSPYRHLFELVPLIPTRQPSK